MDTNTFESVQWDRALIPHFAAQPAWTRVPTKPLCPTSNLSTIMTRVSTLTQRCQSQAAARQPLTLPPFPGMQRFLSNLQNPREEQDIPHKRMRDDTFLSSDDIHQVMGQPDSKAQAVHDECKALVDVANYYMHRAEEHLFPLYRSLRNGTYQAPVTGKRRRSMDESDLDMKKNTFRTICDVMTPILMARRDGKDEVTVLSAAIAFQAFEEYPQNSRYCLVFNGIPQLTDVTERTEGPTPPRRPRVTEPAVVSVDAKSDSDIFATAPIAQSPTTVIQSPSPALADLNGPTYNGDVVLPSIEVSYNSPTTTSTSSEATSDAPPACISQLAEAAGHRLDGNANVVIEEGLNGRLFVRFKISADYASLFPRYKALDDSSMVVGHPDIIASTPKIMPEAGPEAKKKPTDEPINEPSTPTPARATEVVAPITVTTDSTLTDLPDTPIIYEDEESPSREYMRGFIQRSKRAAAVSPSRPALAPRSPNQGSPEKAASPMKPEPALAPAPAPASPKAATPTRRSSRLTNKVAPKSSIPTPIRIDSRSGAGRAKAVKADVTQVTRANTRKNKGKAQYPAEVLAAMEEEVEETGTGSPAKLSRAAKSVHWKSPVEEEPPKRVTRSRARKMAAARA